MSATTDVEQLIVTRLRELEEQLRPLAELEQERTRLQDALQVLRGGASRDGDRAPNRRAATTARSTARSGRKSARPRAAGGGRAKRGSNLKAILEHIGKHPGATASDLATATGISRGVVYSAVSRLAAGGRLRREQQPDGQVAYHLP